MAQINCVSVFKVQFSIQMSRQNNKDLPKLHEVQRTLTSLSVAKVVYIVAIVATKEILKVLQDCTRGIHKHKECVDKDDFSSISSFLRKCALGGVHQNPYGRTHHQRPLKSAYALIPLLHIIYFYPNISAISTIPYIINFNTPTMRRADVFKFKFYYQSFVSDLCKALCDHICHHVL